MNLKSPKCHGYGTRGKKCDSNFTFGAAAAPPAPNTSFPDALLGASAAAAAGAGLAPVRGGAEEVPARAAAAAAAPVEGDGDVFGAFPSSRFPEPVNGVNFGSSGAGSGSAREGKEKAARLGRLANTAETLTKSRAVSVQLLGVTKRTIIF